MWFPRIFQGGCDFSGCSRCCICMHDALGSSQSLACIVEICFLFSIFFKTGFFVVFHYTTRVLLYFAILRNSGRIQNNHFVLLDLYFVLMLYIIPTPIGNLQDITLRAIELLKRLDVLICEDTRSTKKLLQLLDIDYSAKQFYSLTSFSWAKKVDQYVELIKNHDVWLVSDAGTPWLSDPGKKMVEMCHIHTLPFTVLPGANALIPTIVGSGFDTSQFVFVGFLPKKKGKQTLMKEMIGSERPYFFYESVHRIHKVLKELYDLWFRGKVSIGRELTKMHEQLLTDDIEKVLAMFDAGQIPEKGEFVVGVKPI